MAFWRKAKKDDFSDLDLDLGFDDKKQAGEQVTDSFPDAGESSGMDDLGVPGSVPPLETPGMNMPGMQGETRQPTPPPAMTPSPLQYKEVKEREYDMAKELEIISAKLDAIRSSIENINHRLDNLERIANPQQHQRYTW